METLHRHTQQSKTGENTWASLGTDCVLLTLGAIQVLRNAGGGINFCGENRYEGVRFNVISVTRGWVGSDFQEKKALRYT